MWVSQGHYNVPTIYYEIKDFEVIGNIYENPELLNERRKNEQQRPLLS